MDFKDEEFKMFKNSFLDVYEACLREEKSRKKRDESKMPRYRISFLNDACFGILPSELVVVGADTGTGKCFVKDTKVLMFDGSLKNVQDIKPFDKLMGVDSFSRLVQEVHDGYGDIYEIKTNLDISFCVNEEHVLSLKSKEGEIINISVKEYLNNKKYKEKFKLYSVCVEFKKNTLKVDPYLLGLWLACGKKNTAIFNISNKEIIKYLEDYAFKNKYRLSKYKYDYSKQVPSYAIVSKKRSDLSYKIGLKELLNKIKVLNNKHIPECYKINESSVRYNLLAGFIDSRGVLDEKNKSYVLLLNNKNLSKDLVFLCRSLGFLVKESLVEICKKEFYKINIIGDFSKLPLKVNSNKIQKNIFDKKDLLIDFEIIKKDQQKYYGFSLDGDKLFLLDNFIVNHNSQFANDLAFSNAYNGRKVHLFSLEGDEDEVIARSRWQSICKEYYKSPDGREMNYQKYLMNKIPGLEEFEENFRIKMKSIQYNLKIFDRRTTLDIKSLSEKINSIEDTDLIILDHLHYLSLDDTKESTQLTEIMRTIKDITETRGTPIVVVSHLRKKGRDRNVLPDNDDFHGTSNIAKIASTCITISAWPDLDNEDQGLYATLFRITKSRMGAPKKYIANVFFDVKKNNYNNSYNLYKIVGSDLKQVNIEDYPSWATMRFNNS